MRFDLLISTIAVSITPDGRPVDRKSLFSLRHAHEEAVARISPCGGGDRCPDPFSCLWHSTFARMTGGDPETVRRHQKPSPPFAWQFRDPAEGEPRILIHLFGQAARDPAPHLAAIEGIRLPSEASVRFEATPSSDISRTIDDIAATTPDLPDPLSIEILSPLRLVHEGGVMTVFDPSPFLIGLVRRTSSLSAWYGDHPIDADFRDLSLLCRSVTLRDSTIRWVRWSGKVQGVTGRVTLSGVTRELAPFLLAGEYLNAGKGASWGLGRFRISR